MEETQLDNKLKYLEKNKTDKDSIEKNNEISKNNKAILKTERRLKSERHNVFIEESNKITLSSNDDKRMQSIDLIKTYAYGTSKYLVGEK